MQEEEFDVTQAHRNKSNLFKEIAEHNKSIKVNCYDNKELLQFLQSLKAGDVVYKSIKSHFTILRIDPIPTTHNGSRVAPYFTFGEAQDSKGNTFELELDKFRGAAIYKDRPRSYNELKDPK